MRASLLVIAAGAILGALALEQFVRGLASLGEYLDAALADTGDTVPAAVREVVL